MREEKGFKILNSQLLSSLFIGPRICCDKKFLCCYKKMAWKPKIYVVAKNCESQNRIVATKISMPQQLNDSESLSNVATMNFWRTNATLNM